MKTLALPAVVWTCLVALRPVAAQGAEPAADPLTILRLVRQLGDDDFAVREKAERQLKAIGEPALPELRKAAAGRDLEAASRARKLIAVIGWDAVQGRFRKFAGLSPADAEAAFESAVLDLARLADSGVDEDRVKKKLDDYAARVRNVLGDRKTAADVAFALRHVLEVQEKFTGKTINDDDYNKPEHSFLPAVLESKQGLPIALAAVYVLVGRRAGLPVVGVGAPLHFICKVSDPDPAREIFIDAYRNRTFTRADFDTVFGPGADEQQREAVLAVSPAKATVRRMVQNLINAYARSGDSTRLEQATALSRVLDEGK